MPCGCKNKASYVVGAHGIPKANPKPDSTTGVIEPYSLESTTMTAASTDEPVECVPYKGMFHRTTVYIVGHGTPDETFYVRGDRDKAIAQARAEGLTLDGVVAGSLCDHLMYELLEA